MAFEQIRMDRPLSRLELAIVVLLIALCFTWFLNRMNEMAAIAEATALDLTLRSLNTGIMTATAAGLIRGQADVLVRLAEANPVGSAIEPPPGYIGAVRNANPASIQPGQWYYDEDHHWLVYHIVNADYLSGAPDKSALIRIQLKLTYNDANENGAYDPGVDEPSGVSVMVLDQPEWNF